MTTLIKKHAASGNLFIAAYAIWLCASVCDDSLVSGLVPAGALTALKYLMLLVLGVSALANGLIHRRSDWLALAALAIIAVLVRITSGSSIVLFATAFVYCARDVGYERVARCTVLALSACCAAVVLLSQMGVIQDYIWNPDTRGRHGLGFMYCTTLSHYIFNIAVALMVLRRGQPKNIELAVLFLVNLVILILTDSKNSFALVVLLILVCIAARVLPQRVLKNEALLRLCAQWTLLTLVAASLLLCAIYDPSVSWLSNLNDALANRLAQSHESLFNYPLTPFGQELFFLGNGLNSDGVLDSVVHGNYDANYVDNSFLSTLLGYGVITFAAAIALLVAAGGRIAKMREWPMALALFMLALHSAFDPQMLLLQFSFPLFAIAVLLPGQTFMSEARAADKGMHDEVIKRRWYHLGIGGMRDMFNNNKRLRKTILTGCVLAVVCAVVLGLFGYISERTSGTEAYVASQTVNVTAVSGANDTQATKSSLSGIAANDMADYIKAAETRTDALDAAGVSTDDAVNYGLAVAHTAGTRVISVSIIGPDKQMVQDALANVMDSSEAAGIKTFNLEKMETVSSSVQESTVKADGTKVKTPRPKRTAALYALAGLAIGVLITIAQVALDPRVRSEADAEDAAGLAIAGRVNLHSA